MLDKIKNINNSSYLIKGIGVSLFITFILLVILSAVLTYTSLSEDASKNAIIVINGISVLIGSRIAIKKHKSKGLLKGGIFGLLYVFVMYLTSSTISLDYSFNMSSIYMIIFSIIAGMVGGIIAINFWFIIKVVL